MTQSLSKTLQPLKQETCGPAEELPSVEPLFGHDIEATSAHEEHEGRTEP